MWITMNENTEDIACKCVGKHIPKPMATYRYDFLEGDEVVFPSLLLGKKEDDRPHVWVCSTTLDNVQRLDVLYNEYKGRPPWDILKGYSEYARYIVEKSRNLRRIEARIGTTITINPA
jgi:hypothetical protein